MKEYIGDECIYFHIHQLKNGSVQFADSTNSTRAGYSVQQVLEKIGY